MADRYWVGGTANWDATAGTKWSTTSGGAGGAAVPTTGDDVFVDSFQGAQTLTVTTAPTIRHLTFTSGFTGTVSAGGPTITLSGNLTLSPNQTAWTGLSVACTGGNNTITCNGKNFSGLNINNAGFTTQLADTCRVTSGMTLTAGTFTCNSFDLYINISFTSTGATTRVLNMGSGTWHFLSSAATNFTLAATGLTVNPQTSTINAVPSAGASFTITSAGFALNNLKVTGGFARNWILAFVGSTTLANIDMSAVTIDGIVISLGNSTSLIFTSWTPGTAKIRFAITGVTGTATLSCASGFVNLGAGWFTNLIGSGGATFGSLGGFDGGNNTGILFYEYGPRAGVRVGA